VITPVLASTFKLQVNKREGRRPVMYGGDKKYPLAVYATFENGGCNMI
jgi:hypothetical protein